MVEVVSAFVVALLRYLFLNAFLAGIGYFFIKAITLGRYPRTLDPREVSSPDFEIMAVVGAFAIVVLVLSAMWIAQ